jgi:hypothetical protein
LERKKPREMQAEEKEPFLARWSRLKREAPAEKKESSPAPAPVVPPIENLTPESDFTAFMNPKVNEALRRLALKKLFSDPHFNVPDPFEPYSRDWNDVEALTPELLATLHQARSVLFSGQDKKPDAERATDENKGEAKPDEPGRQDT